MFVIRNVINPSGQRVRIDAETGHGFAKRRPFPSRVDVDDPTPRVVRDALEQLVRIPKQRFGTKRVTVLGPRHVQERLTKMAAERGLEIAQERQR